MKKSERAGYVSTIGNSRGGGTLLQRVIRVLPFVVAMLLPPVCSVAQRAGAKINQANRAVRAGNYARAEVLLRSSLAEIDSADATDDRIPMVLNALGQTLRLQRKYDEAEPVYLRVIAYYEAEGRTGGVEYPEAFRQLAVLYERAGKIEQAGQTYSRALEEFDAAGASSHRNAGLTLQALGGLYVRSGMLESADTSFRRAIDILESSPGVRPQVLATTINNLAVVVQNLGDFDEARSLYRRAIEFREQEWGSNDPRLATAIANLATLYRRQADFVVADSLYLRALAIYETQTDQQVNQLLPLLINIGMNYERLGRDEAVVDAYERAMTLINDYGVADDQLFVMVAGVLAGRYVILERYTEAEPLLLTTADAMRRMYGERHEGLAGVLSQYAIVLGNTGRFDEAEQVTEHVKSIWGERANTRTRRRRAQAQGPSEERIGMVPPEAPTVEAGLGRIYRSDAMENGQRILSVTPHDPDCSQYDPEERMVRQPIEDRYEQHIPLEQMPERVEAQLDLVVGIDGQVIPTLSKVLRTTDIRMNETLLQWVESCRFTPGAIGDQAVRVRVEFPVTLEFVRD